MVRLRSDKNGIVWDFVQWQDLHYSMLIFITAIEVASVINLSEALGRAAGGLFMFINSTSHH